MNTETDRSEKSRPSAILSITYSTWPALRSEWTDKPTDKNKIRLITLKLPHNILKIYKTSNVRITQQGGAFTKLYIFVRAWSSAWVSACVCVCACGCTGAGTCFRVCSLTYPAGNTHETYRLRPLWLRIFRNYLINGTI